MKLQILKATTLCLLVATLFSCKNTTETDGITAISADFITLTVDNAVVTKSFPGNIEGQDQVEIKPQVSGYLEAVFVKEGQYVTKGQSLFKIQPAVYQEQLNQSQAALKAALAQQANARLEIDRLKPLVDGHVISDEQLKTALIQLDAINAQVAHAKAVVGSSKINTDFTNIKAPIEGYISRIPYKVGNLVSPNDPAPLTSLANINNVAVYFSMSESDFLTYRKTNLSNDKTSVELLLADGSIYDLKGKLEVASGNIHANTGSILMKAVFQNPHKLLRAGGTAKVLLNNPVQDVLKIPKTASKDIQDKFFVYRLADNNQVKMVAIEIAGGTNDTFFVKAGVKAGDKIAINRIDVLTDGALVLPQIQ